MSYLDEYEEELERKRAIEELQTKLKQVKNLRDRKYALERLVRMITLSKSSNHTIKNRRGRFFYYPNSHREPEEFILTEEERLQFAEWCEEKAIALGKEADEKEYQIAQGGAK